MKSFFTHTIAFILGALCCFAFTQKVSAMHMPQATAAPAPMHPAGDQASDAAPAPVVQTNPATGNVQVQASNVEVKASAVTVTAPAKAEDKKQQEKPATFTQIVGTTLNDMVVVYRNPEGHKEAIQTQPFGKAIVASYGIANQCQDEGQRTVKTEFVDRAQEQFTKNVLSQDELHLPSYTTVIRKAANQNNVEVVEALERDRLIDEAVLEKMANPSIWQRLSWWWNS